MAKESRAKAAMGGSKKSSSKKGKHRVHKMHVSRGPAGGFTVQHEDAPGDDGMPGAMSDPHPLNDMAALQQHTQANMGDQPPAAAPAAAPAAGPAAPAAPQAGPAGM